MKRDLRKKTKHFNDSLYGLDYIAYIRQLNRYFSLKC